LRVITKLFFGGVIVLGTALGLAAPAGADAGAFDDLSCSCPNMVSSRGTSVDQLNRGIQAGLMGIDAVEAAE
jgi:hypothetical protein